MNNKSEIQNNTNRRIITTNFIVTKDDTMNIETTDIMPDGFDFTNNIYQLISTTNTSLNFHYKINLTNTIFLLQESYKSNIGSFKKPIPVKVIPQSDINWINSNLIDWINEAIQIIYPKKEIK